MGLVLNHRLCAYCKSEHLKFEARFPDSNFEIVEIYSCEKCGVFVPSYKKNAFLDEQFKLHEDLWLNTCRNEWQKAKDAMKEMVQIHEKFIGPPTDTTLVVDIGSGRGNLSAALKDIGYNILSCEPSSNLHRQAINNYKFDKNEYFNLEVEVFLDRVLKKEISSYDSVSIYLWHVLEHISFSKDVVDRIMEVCEGKKINVFIQMPMLKSEYIFPEHYFLATPDWFEFISKQTGLKCIEYFISNKNLYISGFYSNIESFGTVDIKRPFRSLSQFERLSSYLINR